MKKVSLFAKKVISTGLVVSLLLPSLGNTNCFAMKADEDVHVTYLLERKPSVQRKKVIGANGEITARPCQDNAPHPEGDVPTLIAKETRETKFHKLRKFVDSTKDSLKDDSVDSVPTLTAGKENSPKDAVPTLTAKKDEPKKSKKQIAKTIGKVVATAAVIGATGYLVYRNRDYITDTVKSALTRTKTAGSSAVAEYVKPINSSVEKVTKAAGSYAVAEYAKPISRSAASTLVKGTANGMRSTGIYIADHAEPISSTVENVTKVAEHAAAIGSTKLKWKLRGKAYVIGTSAIGTGIVINKTAEQIRALEESIKEVTENAKTIVVTPYRLVKSIVTFPFKTGKAVFDGAASAYVKTRRVYRAVRHPINTLKAAWNNSCRKAEERRDRNPVPKAKHRKRIITIEG